jgi:hypothetical protein
LDEDSFAAATATTAQEKKESSGAAGPAGEAHGGVYDLEMNGRRKA